MKYEFIKRENLKEKPHGSLGFGKYFTDYMFSMDYTDEVGWHDMKILPYGDVNLNPATMVLHYAQETFEGLKAYRGADGKVYLFRPEMNARRFINSNKRMCMPIVPEDLFIGAIEELVKVEEAWIPEKEGESLYIRPFMFANETSVGVHVAKTYKFLIIASPVGAYYPQGIDPVKIYVEDEYVRASPGGTGFVKCGGNYAASLIGQAKAEELGYTQVLWLDGVHRRYVEEVGSMNAMFVIDGKVITAPIEGTVLPGVTRDSILKLLEEYGYEVVEKHLSIDELIEAARSKKLTEAFGTGTAAVISPIGELYYKGEKVQVNDFKTGNLTHRLYKDLTDIQWAKVEDKYAWRREVK
ncbi:branched-chain amino acid aminotransferase [Anaerococcus tetradius]|uniref:branched-chain amino acid aminotransferase n=1 Tax=Anaerococcus tetradius TaxID=33036 RepID=UPI0023F0024A|nr:branched-chain amino acid aminotransferase [Anaerococcus tetradius]